ncbi:MAG: efflux RND transporter periplasmic adaptor subunit [Hyphomicrobiaceae bacterium]|nr:efflux RND transporter periplasmic adaptor subunit [Hyphomicrobiaceae bacterium]
MPDFTLLLRAVLALCLLGASLASADAHEGHDHGKPPSLALPAAPRVVAVTPDFELVGVASGEGRLTVFLHSFATNAPIQGAGMTISAGDQSAEAKPEGAGVFSVALPWLSTGGDVDLVFSLRLADGSEDLLTGTLRHAAARPPAATAQNAESNLGSFVAREDLLLSGGAGLALGVLLTLLLAGGRSSSKTAVKANEARPPAGEPKPEGDAAGVRLLRRSIGALALVGATILPTDDARAADAAVALPSVPPTTATDLPQRMPDGTLFVPKATQHLLSIRTMLTAEGTAPIATELTGTVTAGPANFGRVQPGRPGRIEATPEGLAFVGKRVEKGDLLAYVQTYIEAADRANIDSLIAETEARIEKNKTILSRYMASPGAVPQVRVDEVQGEIEALRRKREELLPSVRRREPVTAPISGVVSLANATIGQIVEGRDVLFEIVDPSELWVEAHGHNHEGNALQGMTAAFAIDPHGHRLPLALAGRGLVLRHQASVSTFRILEGHDSLSVGMPVKVVIQSSRRVSGFVLPSSAVVRGESGLPTVWIKTEAERFEAQVVKTAQLDGLSVVVTAGLRIDKRVVVEGATLLDQVR